MKKRVRKTQRLTRWFRDHLGVWKSEEIVVKHDSTRPVRSYVGSRVAAYAKQNGGDWLTPRQARRVRQKGGATSLPVRGYRGQAGRPKIDTQAP